MWPKKLMREQETTVLIGPADILYYLFGGETWIECQAHGRTYGRFSHS